MWLLWNWSLGTLPISVAWTNTRACVSVRLLQLQRSVLTPDSEMPDELLYGRAGYLYALLYINKEIRADTVDESTITKVTHTHTHTHFFFKCITYLLSANAHLQVWLSTQILNTHLQIPAHIHKSQYAFRDFFTHWQIWSHRHRLRYSYTHRSIMAP